MPCVRHLPRCTDCSPRPYEEVHRALARRAAEEGIILLKNENHTLPLPSGCRIALYGTGALHTLKGGTGSGDVNARETVSIRDGLYAAGFQIANEAWLQHCDTIYRQARSKWRDRVWEQLETGQQPHFFAAYVNTPFQAPACAPAKAACDAALYGAGPREKGQTAKTSPATICSRNGKCRTCAVCAAFIPLSFWC